MEVTVCVGTFGSRVWLRMARQAMESVPEGVRVIHAHEQTLAQARNAALNQVETEWAIHLDADDTLGEGYIDAMAQGSADLRGPSVQRWRGGQVWDPDPYMPQVAGHSHACEGSCLRYGNWLVIGTCIRAELARSVGGWEEFEWSEDWALWARMWKAGGAVEAVPAAVYQAGWRVGSRNKMGRSTSVHWHRAIEQAVWPEESSVL